MTADDDVPSNLSQLGAPIGPMIRVHGFANRMYRLDTDQGSFAVKELNPVDRRWAYHVEDGFRFERAAFAAGIPMPEPISASHHTLVHRWVEGEKVPEAPARSPRHVAQHLEEALTGRFGLAWTARLAPPHLTSPQASAASSLWTTRRSTRNR